MYQRVSNEEKFVSVPHIHAKKIVRVRDDNKSDDHEQQFNGIAL